MIKDQLARLIRKAVESAVEDGSLALSGEITLDDMKEPPNKELGDFACNAALSLARTAGKSPREVAQVIESHIPENALLDRVEIAGPGFLNLYLKPDWLTPSFAGYWSRTGSTAIPATTRANASCSSS